MVHFGNNGPRHSPTPGFEESIVEPGEGGVMVAVQVSISQHSDVELVVDLILDFRSSFKVVHGTVRLRELVYNCYEETQSALADQV